MLNTLFTNLKMPPISDSVYFMLSSPCRLGIKGWLFGVFLSWLRDKGERGWDAVQVIIQGTNHTV